MGIYLEFLISKSEKVLLDRVQDRCDTMLNQLSFFGQSTALPPTLESYFNAGSVHQPIQLRRLQYLPSNTFREIVKRLQSFGILNVTVDNSRLTENVHCQLFVYHDEITAAFEHHEIYKHFEETIKIHTQGSNGAGGTAAGLTGVD